MAPEGARRTRETFDTIGIIRIQQKYVNIMVADDKQAYSGGTWLLVKLNMININVEIDWGKNRKLLNPGDLSNGRVQSQNYQVHRVTVWRQ